jgi:hypothetical protein
MAYTFPEGAAIYFSQTFASAKVMSAITNADPAVATVTAHGYSDNDEVLVESGWEDATDCVVRVEETGVNSLNMHGLNTTDTDFFPAGSGTGNLYKISSWVAIPQVLTIATSGGDPRFTTISPLAKRNSISVPTGFNPTSITLSLGHDASNANYQTMLSVSRSLTKVAFKLVMSGSVVYGYGYLAVSEMPALNVGQPNTVQASFTLLGRALSYES